MREAPAKEYGPPVTADLLGPLLEAAVGQMLHRLPQVKPVWFSLLFSILYKTLGVTSRRPGA